MHGRLFIYFFFWLRKRKKQIKKCIHSFFCNVYNRTEYDEWYFVRQIVFVEVNKKRSSNSTTYHKQRAPESDAHRSTIKHHIWISIWHMTNNNNISRNCIESYVHRQQQERRRTKRRVPSSRWLRISVEIRLRKE